MMSALSKGLFSGKRGPGFFKEFKSDVVVMERVEKLLTEMKNFGKLASYRVFERLKRSVMLMWPHISILDSIRLDKTPYIIF